MDSGTNAEKGLTNLSDVVRLTAVVGRQTTTGIMGRPDCPWSQIIEKEGR